MRRYRPRSRWREQFPAVLCLVPLLIVGAAYVAARWMVRWMNGRWRDPWLLFALYALAVIVGLIVFLVLSHAL